MSAMADRPNAAAVVWRCVAFDGLSVHGLYGLLRLRSVSSIAARIDPVN